MLTQIEQSKMKTQKQLPKLFYIQENEITNKYCNKLGLDLNGYKIKEKNYGDYLVFRNNENINAYYKTSLDVLKEHYPNALFVDLADYIKQEQPELIKTIPASKSVITSVLSGFNGSMEFKTDGNRIPIGQKWQEKTRGGYEYHIYEEFEGRIYGRVKTHRGNWLANHWYDKGDCSPIEKDSWDLLPYNLLLTTLEKELEELRVKEKEILEKIEGLKK